MPHPLFFRPDQSRHADLDRQAGLGSAVTALGLYLLDGAGAAAALVGGRIRDGFVRWLRRRNAIRELGALDDRMLRDIGLYRADIPDLVEDLMNRRLPRPTMAAAGSRRPGTPFRMEPRGQAAVRALRPDAATRHRPAVPAGCG